MKYLLIILSITAAGCRRIPGPPQSNISGSNILIIKIDGCEYLYNTFYNTALTHKGDCANPAHGTHYIIPSTQP